MIHGTVYGPGFYAVVHCEPDDLDRVLEWHVTLERIRAVERAVPGVLPR